MSPSGRSIIIPHLGRVEGHGGIFVKIVGNTVHEVNMDIFEGSRYYEALLKGKHFLEVQGIITRVCAICSANHTVAALTALENALGITAVGARPHAARAAAARRHHRVPRAARVRPRAAGLPRLRLGHQHGLEVPGRGGVRAQAQAARQPDPGARRRPRRPPDQHAGRRVRQAAPAPRPRRRIRDELAAALDPLMGIVDLAATLPVPGLGRAADRLRGAAAVRGGVPLPRRSRSAPRAARSSRSRRTATWSASSPSSTRTPSTRALASGETYMVGSLARLKLWGHYLGGRAREAFERLFPGGVVGQRPPQQLGAARGARALRRARRRGVRRAARHARGGARDGRVRGAGGARRRRHRGAARHALPRVRARRRGHVSCPPT